jgi:hypothetical protein
VEVWLRKERFLVTHGLTPEHLKKRKRKRKGAQGLIFGKGGQGTILGVTAPHFFFFSFMALFPRSGH